MEFNYDIIVVGAGHAGCEAAHSAASLGRKVLLITLDMMKIGEMSCNPAMGGVAKGQIVREIDALGGMSGLITDKTMIQFRMLNRSKGPAMWSPRAQSDKMAFAKEWRKTLEKNRNVDFWQDAVKSIIVKSNNVVGVTTKLGLNFFGEKVILTTGTFENGLIHIGNKQFSGGRMSEQASTGISKQLKDLGFEVGRMKTGTPARIDGRSINFSKLDEQKGDEEGGSFSYLNEKIKTNHSCFIAYTSEEVHNVLREGFEQSPLFNGTINGVGPRYCPSIEDKLITFSEKNKHQLFLEPEGENTFEMYLNGFSSSLPLDVQFRALRKIVGFEGVKIFRPGYAIEYDYYPPTQLKPTLETKRLNNLYFAGQINGTTGYEEAAGQGLIAGINASLSLDSNDEFILSRNESYIGVLIDDLITKGVDEPYRMFTSRAEHRILLRQDNADERLTEKGYNISLVTDDRLKIYHKKLTDKKELLDKLKNESIKPDQINVFLKKLKTSEIKQQIKLIDITKRPQVKLEELLQELDPQKFKEKHKASYFSELCELTEIEVKYNGYIEREKTLANKIQRLENITIPIDINYHELKSISTEARQKLSSISPKTIGMASRIPGVSPADINVLLVYLGR